MYFEELRQEFEEKTEWISKFLIIKTLNYTKENSTETAIRSAFFSVCMLYFVYSIGNTEFSLLALQANAADIDER